MENKIKPTAPVFGEVLDLVLHENRSGRGTPARVSQSYAAALQPDRRHPALNVAQVMSSPVTTVAPDERAHLALTLMSERRIRHLPVIEHGKLVGILSDRDLLRLDPADQLPVSTLMSERPIITGPGSPIRHAAQLMFEARVSALPVVDDSGVLVGIITTTDILRAIFEKAPIELWA